MKLKVAILAVFIALLMVPAGTQAQEDTDELPHHPTGCLRKGAAANTYTLTDENGKTWDISSRTVSLKTHVGHTVTVTGTIPKRDDSSDSSVQQNRLLVTDLKMVRDNCKQP